MHHNEYADLYLRTSQDRDGSTAIERQDNDCRKWAERNEMDVPATVPTFDGRASTPHSQP